MEKRLPSGRVPSQYANCAPEAVSTGSAAQMLYFVRDAKQDISYLLRRVEELEGGE